MHKDATGRSIQKGDYIVYAVTQGSRSGLKFGVITKLTTKDGTRNEYNNNTQTWASVPHVEYKVQIISSENSWIPGVNGGPGHKAWHIQGKTEGKLARTQTLDRLDRVVVLNPDQVNPDAKEALDKEMHERGQ